MWQECSESVRERRLALYKSDQQQQQQQQRRCMYTSQLTELKELVDFRQLPGNVGRVVLHPHHVDLFPWENSEPVFQKHRVQTLMDHDLKEIVTYWHLIACLFFLGRVFFYTLTYQQYTYLYLCEVLKGKKWMKTASSWEWDPSYSILQGHSCVKALRNIVCHRCVVIKF